MENLPKEIRALYANLIPAEHNKLESREKINLGSESVPQLNANGEVVMVNMPKEEPYIKIKVEGTKAILAFIHGGDPPFNFANLLDGFVCWASVTGKTEIELHDNATFTDATGECKYNALLFRALQGKLGIYAGRGWLPAGGIGQLQRNLDIIRSFKKNEALELIPLLPATSGDLIGLLRTIDRGDESPIGPWITSQPCEIYREFINRIDTLGNKSAKIENVSVHPLTPAQRFLFAVGKYVSDNEHLFRAPACPEAHGGGRRSPRKTQRRKYKCRSTRKSRRHSTLTRSSRS
jgi:glutaredoxin